MESRARESLLTWSAMLLVSVIALTACGETSTDSGEDADASTESGTSDPPTDASLADFCYAIQGIDSLEDGAPPDLIQERIDLLAETGTTADAPDDLRRDVVWLVEWARERGDQVIVSDLDAASDHEDARNAPSPYDDPDRALTEYREDNCDGVYVDDFSTEGQSTDEDTIDNILWERNQYIESGECDRLPELYTADSAIDAESCYAGTETTYELVGGGVTGPDSADLLVETAGGERWSIDGAVREDGTWKLTAY
ncbi:hypothetical protein [Nocardioides pelophilus]|uniref:hypothetical protein n=1 Tax=Nocardioides pelophilus TaxID=2172019 RepID=UPI0016042F37|nr:hypothetical protein [Nocardioides pelophilus]